MIATPFATMRAEGSASDEAAVMADRGLVAAERSEAMTIERDDS